MQAIKNSYETVRKCAMYCIDLPCYRPSLSLFRSTRYYYDSIAAVSVAAVSVALPYCTETSYTVLSTSSIVIRINNPQLHPRDPSLHDLNQIICNLCLSSGRASGHLPELLAD